MWTIGILLLMSVATVFGGPITYKQEPSALKSESILHKRQALDKPYINIPVEGDGNEKDEGNKYSEEEKGIVSQEKEGPEEQNPAEVILEVVKPPSFIESIFTWPPSFTWPPTFSWPSFELPTFELPTFELPTFELPTFEWPTFELPTISWPSFLGGRAQVVYPENYYYHYANYPNNPNYRYVSLNDGTVYYSS